MGSIQSKLRKLRTIQFLLISLVLVSASLAVAAKAKSRPEWAASNSWITVLGAFCALEGFYIRRRFISPAGAALASNSADQQALRRWEAWQYLALMLASAIGFYGYVIRVVLHGTMEEALWFYLIGLVLLVIWTPRIPAQMA